MSRAEREDRKLFAIYKLDAELLRKKNHFVWKLRNEYGCEMRFVSACSPSDKRGSKNNEATLRRFAAMKETAHGGPNP